MAFFPLILVVIAAVSSAIYKHYNSRKLTASVRCMLIKYHAFATELLQLLILGSGVFVGWGYFSSATIMLDIYFISDMDFPVPAWFVATMTVSGYFLALFAIDLVDNRIQLGCWQHPVQTQTLLLTRSVLVPESLWTIHRRTTKKPIERPTKKEHNRKKVLPVRTTPYQRKRTTSEPVTPEMLRRFLREIPAEISRSGVLIREARALARRASAAATVMRTPTRGMGGIEAVGLMTPETPRSVGFERKYEVQSRVESIERAVCGLEAEGDGLMGL